MDNVKGAGVEKVAVQFYTTKEMREQIRILAEHDGRTISSYLRRVISLNIARGERDGLFRK